MQSCGGTNGSFYDTVLNHPLDYLFCVDGNGNLYNIIMEDLRKAGNTKSFSLRTKPTTNGQGFQTYKYIVSI